MSWDLRGCGAKKAHKTTIDPLGLSNILAKKEEFAQNHTTILRDEYKIEDMMVTVKSSTDYKQAAPQDLVSWCNVSARSLPFGLTLELTFQELILVQESFGDIYLKKEGRKSRDKLDLIERKDEYF